LDQGAVLVGGAAAPPYTNMGVAAREAGISRIVPISATPIFQKSLVTLFEALFAPKLWRLLKVSFWQLFCCNSFPRGVVYAMPNNYGL
jgi:hypothetical protein